MIILIFFCGLFLNFQNGVEGAKMLALMNAASPSHSLWNDVLVNALAEKGHTVTVLIADLPRNSANLNKNIKYYKMDAIYSTIYAEAEIKDYVDINAFQMMMGYSTFSIDNCKGTLKSDGFIQFMNENENEKFDLILHDFTFGPCLLGLVHMYNYPPVVAVSAFPFTPLATKFMGGHYYPSYVSYHSFLSDLKSSFVDRMINTVLFICEELSRIYYMNPQMDKLTQKLFPKGTPPVGELEKLSAIALIGSHPAITKACSLPQNVIEIGGLNLIDPKPLPVHLESFINGSKKGAVLFSLGTNLKPKDVGMETIEQILKVMGKYPDYHFMWKFESTLIKDKIPKNVLIQDFFPQRDILANPKTKCFITHAGGLSTQESIWFGVPMITIPLFADQITNSNMAVTNEIAIQIKFFELNEKLLSNALNKILNNRKYNENIKIQSSRFRDRPMKPLDTATWWIEYVLRHPNPDHLRVPTLEMGFFVANSFDFLLLVLVVVVLVVYVEVKIIKCLCCRGSKTVKDKKVKRN